MTTSPDIPPPPLRLGDAGAAGGGLRSGRQPTVETASPLARLDLAHGLPCRLRAPQTGLSFRGRGERLPLKPSACSSRQSAPILQRWLEQVCRPFEGRTDNPPIPMPTVPSLERDSAACWR